MNTKTIICEKETWILRTTIIEWYEQSLMDAKNNQ